MDNNKMLEVLEYFSQSSIVNNFLEKEVKPIFLKTLESTLDGWHYDILIGLDGIKIVGLISSGNMPISVYEGKEFTLAKIPSSKEFKLNIDTDTLNNLSEEEQEKLTERLAARIFDIEEYEAYENTGYYTNESYEEEKVNVHFFNTSYTYIELEEEFRELFPDKWEELKKEYYETEWEYMKEEIEIYIRQNIIDIRLELLNNRE